ncbi:MAG: exopolyphosphatase [Actinobacteria bacterium]|nr:exopolyphosphatase [Actinomycetota bacterium]
MDGAAVSDRPAAAIDVGSNSVRVKVVGPDGDQLARELAITRLGTGIDATGRFDEDSLARTLDVVERFASVWRDHGVDAGDVRIAATSAVRDAADRDRFFAGVRDRTGVEAEVLSGEEEAATAYRGVVSGLDVPRPVAVLDIGGGSTELIVGDGAGEVAGSWSLQLGSVRLTERYLAGDPPTDAEVAAADGEITRRLDELDAQLASQGCAVRDATTIVGVAGTVTTVAALDAGLSRYTDGCVHGRRLEVGALRAWADRLTGMPSGEIGASPVVQAGREDVIAGGARIAAAVVERYGFDALVVSEADILDGLALSALERGTGRGRAREGGRAG